MSVKTRDRIAEAKPIREALIAKAGKCMICYASPGARNGRMGELNNLCVHEIAGGPLRQKSLDKPYACLVLCWGCNQQEVEDKSRWPRARQLALLQVMSPDDYDLVAFNYLVNPKAPNAIEPHEVEEYAIAFRARRR